MSTGHYHRHQLTVVENFLGEELTSTKQLERVLRGLERKQQVELRAEIKRFEKAWVPAEGSEGPIVHLGRAYNTFSNPQYWRDHCVSTGVEVGSILRLLVYIPKLTIWTKSFMLGPARHSLYGDLAPLIQLKPFLEDGSVQFVPDAFYTALCGRRHARSRMVRFAVTESQKEIYRKIVDGVSFFDSQAYDYEDWDYHNFFANRESIVYCEPLNDLNEDIVVQSVIGAHTLCATPAMRDLVALKYASEAEITKELTWSNVSLLLPGLRQLDLVDLLSVRRDEDAFLDWRLGLAAALRESTILIESGKATKSAISEIFQDTAGQQSRTLQDKIRSRRIRSLIEPKLVSFASGAMAAWLTSGSVAAAVKTGAVSTSLSLIHDILKSKRIKSQKAMLRLFAHLGGL